MCITKKLFLFIVLGYYENLIRMHQMFEWIHSTVPTLDLLQVEEVKAPYLVGWALGNGVKNEFVLESDDKMWDCLIHHISPVLLKCVMVVYFQQNSLSLVSLTQKSILLHAVCCHSVFE